MRRRRRLVRVRGGYDVQGATGGRAGLADLGGDAFVDLEVEVGVVTLNGQVPGLDDKRLAGVLAWWVPGSRDVINGVAVEPPEDDDRDWSTSLVPVDSPPLSVTVTGIDSESSFSPCPGGWSSGPDRVIV